MEKFPNEEDPYPQKMMTWIGYMAFNKILITKLDKMTLLKTTQIYGAQMKSFKVKEPK